MALRPASTASFAEALVCDEADVTTDNIAQISAMEFRSSRIFFSPRRGTFAMEGPGTAFAKAKDEERGAYSRAAYNLCRPLIVLPTSSLRFSSRERYAASFSLSSYEPLGGSEEDPCCWSSSLSCCWS